MSTSQIKAIDDTVQLYTRNALCHAIRTAVELGIVRVLKAGQKTVAQLAQECELSENPLGKLMEVLAETELIERYENFFALSASGQLIPEAYLDFGDRYWKNLADYVRTGIVPASEPGGGDGGGGGGASDYVTEKWSREWMLTPAAIDLASLLDIGKSRRAQRVLELGCGSAVFSATLIHQDPNSTAMLVDTAAGLARSKATIKSLEIENRIEWVTAEDIFNLPAIPELVDQKFDLVLLTGVSQRISSETIEDFLKQLSTLLKPGGELALVDLFPGQPAGVKDLAVADLELHLRTGHGQLHKPAELQTMLQRTGFANIQYAHLPSPPNTWGLVLSQLG